MPLADAREAVEAFDNYRFIRYSLGRRDIADAGVAMLQAGEPFETVGRFYVENTEPEARAYLARKGWRRGGAS